MSGIDRLVSHDLTLEIKNNLNKDNLSKIERDLFFNDGMSIKLAIEHFEKLLILLKKNTEFDIEHFYEKHLKKIMQITKFENNFELKITSQRLSELIFNYFGDPESRAILLTVMSRSLTVPEILKKSKVLKSPGYRKIENMLLDGVIVDLGRVISNQKRVSQYRCIFDKLSFLIKKDTYFVEGVINSKIFKQSSLYISGFLKV